MSLEVYEITRPLDWNRHNSDGAVIVDSVTDVPLPLQLFPSADCAEHFLLWANREGREPFGSRERFYNVALLNDSYSDWWDKCMADDDNLTDTAQKELADKENE